MGVYTNINFLNANDIDFIAARNGSAEVREEWEDENGSMADRPGATIPDTGGIVHETDDEYGGWIIAIADIPKHATHIVVYRG